MNRFIPIHLCITGMVFVIAFMLLLSGTTPAAVDDFLIVANKAVAVDHITREDIKAIFMGKKRIWDSGQEIVFAVFDDAVIQEKFMQRYLQTSLWQFKNYWTRKVFSGMGRMPRFFENKAEVLKFVRANPGAISFIPAPAESDVKVLKVK